MASYKHIIISEFGGREKLQVKTEAVLPEPGPGQIRVKVQAAGTGFTDTIIREGQYVDVKDKPPFTLGYDWFGVVDKLGEGVSEFALGQSVANMSIIGGYTEYLCVDVEEVVAAPDGLDPAEAVSMLLSYTTAFQMLTRIRKLAPGDTCLVHAAGGAVGTALLELAKLMELKVFASASSNKREHVESYGAKLIDYRTEDFVEVIKAEGGVDIAFDTIGGKSWAKSYRCINKGGALVAFGALQLTTGEEKLPSLLLGFAKLKCLWPLLPDGKQSTFYNIVNQRKRYPEEFKEDVATLFAWLKAGKLKPVVAKRLPLTEAEEAHRLIDNALVQGKVVLLNE